MQEIILRQWPDYILGTELSRTQRESILSLIPEAEYF